MRDATKAASRSVPAGMKESCRWVEGYARLAEQAELMPQTRLVYVADREGDFIDLLVRASALGTRVDWLVRSAHNRKLVAQQDKLWDGFGQTDVLGELRFTLPARPNQKARAVRQQLLARRYELRTPDGEALPVNVVLEQEIDAPERSKPIIWRLLTNRTVATLEDVAELIDWYRCRWEVELFFHILKNGCKVEELRLSTIDRLKLALALLRIVAWRIQLLMRLGRTCPAMDCEEVFDREEWQAAYLVARKSIPSKSPPLNPVVRLIARFGGFSGPKRDGEPGVKTIWIGLLRITDFALGIRALQAADICV